MKRGRSAFQRVVDPPNVPGEPLTPTILRRGFGENRCRVSMVNEAEKSRSNQAVVRRQGGGGRNLPVDAGGIGVRGVAASFAIRNLASTGIVDISGFVLLGRSDAPIRGGQAQASKTKYRRSAMEKASSITIQALAKAKEKPPAEEQWETMRRTMRGTMETDGHRGG